MLKGEILQNYESRSNINVRVAFIFSCVVYRLSAICEEVIVSNGLTAKSLAIDWVAKKIYWTNAAYNLIEVAEFNGSNQFTLFDSNLHDPSAIAVDPFHGFVLIVCCNLFISNNYF